MLNLKQIQTDLWHILMSSSQLRTINFVLQRPLEIEYETAIASCLTDPRNGCAGAGGVVKPATATFGEGSVSGPILDYVWTVTTLVAPTLNKTTATPDRAAKGTFIEPETLMQMVLDEVHHYADEQFSTFVPAPNAVQPATIFNQGGNGVFATGHDISFKLSKPRSPQTLRTGQVQVTRGAGTISFACALDPTAQIRYTLDGSFPASDGGGNPQSRVYSSAVNVVSGQVVRARAYALNKLGSATTFTQI